MSKAAKAELWRRGVLAPWLLWGCQQEVYDAYVASDDRVYVFEIGRRFGKSYIAAVLMCEMAIKKPGAVMQYAASTATAVEEIFLENLQEVLKDCPEDMMPEIIISKGKVRWPNGSSIKMVGAEDRKKANRLRGPKSDLFFIDEAGFIPDLKYLMVTVAAPMLLTTGGRMLVASTPAETVGHRFTSLCIEAEAKGNISRRNIYDSSVNSSPELIAEFIELCGGEDSDEWRREYCAERVTDASRAVVPAFLPNKAFIVKPIVPPAYYDTYVGLDVGWNPSLTVALFGFYDYARATLCIQREMVMDKGGTDEMMDGNAKVPGIKAIEHELWAEYFARVSTERPYLEEIGEVYGRWVDVELRLQQDMSNLHGVDFSITSKDSKDAALNDLSILCARHRLEIDPCCPVLISHLEAGMWNARRTDYVWLDGFGHLDAIDALSYLWRNVDEAHDPTPHHTVASGPDYYTRPGQEDPDLKTLREAFG